MKSNTVAHSPVLRFMPILIAACTTIGLVSACSQMTGSFAGGSSKAGVDLVVVNGKIWTARLGASTTGRNQPTALAVKDERIVAVGNDRSIRSHIGRVTRVIDAKGRRVIPGITDCHTHVINGGFQLARLMLRDAENRAEFVRAVANAARSKKPGDWVLGGRWSVDSWADPSPPQTSWLDPVSGDTPVFLNRMDGHSAVANSAALRLAGIDRNGPADPKGGEIQRDPRTREPTGILKESAMGLVSRVIPEATAGQRYEALRRAMKHANSLGVTSVNDMCSENDLWAFAAAEHTGELSLRITAYLSVSDWSGYSERIRDYGLSSDMLRLAGFKGYMDGSLGSRTAYMHDHYSDATSEMSYPRGQLTALADPPEEFNQLAALADSRDMQLAVHAIGDEGNHLLVDAYEYAFNRNGRVDARHRIEHAQHLLVPDIPRIAALGITASMQPFHKADDGRYAEKAIGRDRLAGSYAFRQLLDAGVLLVFGSDWPVVTLDPFAGIDSAVNAKTLAGDVWLPSHSLTVEEALRAYTSRAARAVHREDRVGTLEVGKYADLVILNQDPFTIAKEQVGSTKADVTIVGGRIVFTR